MEQMQNIIQLTASELVQVRGGEIGNLGGYSGAMVFGGPGRWGGMGAIGGPFGTHVWSSVVTPTGFSEWTGNGYTGITAPGVFY